MGVTAKKFSKRRTRVLGTNEKSCVCGDVNFGIKTYKFPQTSGTFLKLHKQLRNSSDSDFGCSHTTKSYFVVSERNHPGKTDSLLIPESKVH